MKTLITSCLLLICADVQERKCQISLKLVQETVSRQQCSLSSGLLLMFKINLLRCQGVLAEISLDPERSDDPLDIVKTRLVSKARTATIPSKCRDVNERKCVTSSRDLRECDIAYGVLAVEFLLLEMEIILATSLILAQHSNLPSSVNQASPPPLCRQMLKKAMIWPSLTVCTNANKRTCQISRVQSRTSRSKGSAGPTTRGRPRPWSISTFESRTSTGEELSRSSKSR